MSRPSISNSDDARVFIADASPFGCQLLADSLGRRSHLRVIGWAVNSGEVIAGVAEQQPDVALVSSRMQDGELAGFHILQQLGSSGSKTRIVMLLDDSDPQLVVAAFRSGASGVFSRKRRSTELRKCIRCVAAGEIWARNQEILYLIEALQRPAAPHISNSQGIALLTRREEDVVGLAVNGLTNRQIAHELGLSQHTVKNYMFEIFEKLGISTRVELVLYALHHDGNKPVAARTSAEALPEPPVQEKPGQQQQVPPAVRRQPRNSHNVSQRARRSTEGRSDADSGENDLNRKSADVSGFSDDSLHLAAK